ncbi:MAG: hypothetical protein KDA86_08820 [Planctomycetaceae bacterium]|nr:hypothetical protein [Planctomycetaceae bacterium]MCA9112690.1 hypothetical protein [Planctomycetaceae bacterium]
MHILGTAMRILPQIRDDDVKFAEMIELLQRDRADAAERLERLFQMLAEK